MNDNIALAKDANTTDSNCSFFNDTDPTQQTPLGMAYCEVNENNTCEAFFQDNTVEWTKAIPGIGRGLIEGKDWSQTLN